MAWGSVDNTEAQVVTQWEGFTPRVEVAQHDYQATVLASGNVDTLQLNGLIDSGASFSAETIKAGMAVKNTTDDTESSVVAVISPTQLEISTNIFDDIGDEYEVLSDEEGTHTWEAFAENASIKATRVSWNSDDDPCLAEIKLEGTRAEDWQNNVGPSDQVQVSLRTEEDVVNDDGERETVLKNRIIFRGWPASAALSASGEAEDITVLCLGARYFMDRIPVYGQYLWGKTPTGGNEEFTSHFKLVFNEGGRMNRAAGDGGASEPHWTGPYKNGRTTLQDSYFFTWPAPVGKTEEWEGHEFWTAGDAVEYIVNRFKDPDSVVTLDLDVESENFIALREIRLPEVDVDGLSQAQALTRILNSIGYHWCVLPVADTGEMRLYWWQAGVGRESKSVLFPAVGDTLKDLKSDKFVARFEINYDYKNLVNSYVGLGAMELFENDWTLKKGWDTDDESADPADEQRYYRSGLDDEENPDWETYKFVYRRWILDGAGLITDTPYDFGKTAETGDESQLGEDYSLRPRHLEAETLSIDADTGLRKPIQFFIVKDSTDKRTDAHVDAFEEKDRADGVYLDGRSIRLDGEEQARVWEVMEDITETRIIGALRGDNALYELRENAASKISYLTRRKVIRNESFKYEQRWLNEYGSTATVRDDTEKLQEYVDSKVESTKDPVVSVSLSLPFINFEMTPGTLIQEIRGRDIVFGAKTNTEEGYRVTGGTEIVSVDFMLDPEQQMNLSLADTRLRPAT